MAGPMYLVKILNSSETVIQNPPTILRCGSQFPSPVLKFASITEQGGVKNVSIGGYACSADGSARDAISPTYVNYSNLTPDSQTFRDVNGYNLTDLDNNLFCVEQNIKIGEAQLQYGSTFYIDYEKLDIKGFIDDNDSPNYVLKDSVTLSFGSGSTAGTIDFEVSNGRIKILTDAFPRVPQEQDPVTLKFICALDLSEEDFEKAFSQNMDPIQEFNGYGYVFYDSVLVENTYTVTFNSQGGSIVEPYTDVASGSTIARPTDPTKPGYDLSGWYTDTTFETEWNFNTDVVTEDMTLYALWKTHTSTVFFNSQGGSSVEPIDEVAYGETITAPTAPTRTGYDFGGWYKEEECITPWDFDNDVVYVDTTLYAKWTIQTFSVTFDSNGGSQVSPYTGVEYGSTINEPSTPEKLEQDFDGWYKDSEFETAWDFANDTVTEDVTLYAKWVEWRKSRIYNPNAYKGENLTLLRGRKVRREFRPFR